MPRSILRNYFESTGSKLIDMNCCKYSPDLKMKKIFAKTIVNYITTGGEKLHPMVTRKYDITTRPNGGVRPPLGKPCSRSKDLPTLMQRTDALLRGLSLILEHHNAKEKVREDLYIQIHSYLDFSPSETVWLKRCKYLLCYPLAKFLRNVLPPAPDLVFRPKGALRGWMKARLNAFNPSNVHLWYSWFQAKRSTLPLSETIVNDTYRTHLETLTKPDPGDNDFGIIDEIFEDPTFKTVLDKIRRKVTKNYFYRRRFYEEFPKTSACFERPRSSGGQVEELREAVGLDSFCIQSKEFCGMKYSPTVYTRDGLRSNYTQSTYCSQGYDEWSSLQDLVKKTDLTKPLDCTIQAVLEPNKIRVISKGNAVPYYGCKDLQLVLHKILKKMPCFRLIGRPFSPSDLKDLIRKSEGKDDLWCSVDYSAATDGLSYKYSSKIFNSIACNLPDFELELAKKVLGPHNLYYPKEGERGIELRGVQNNGQLMGSILSFPILCLANLGVFLRATKSLRKDWTYEESLNHVLINGDDMVYAAPYKYFKKNVDIGKAVGLEMSVGKAYYHREYLNINSQSVLCPLQSVNRDIRPVNFLNTGLFFGLHKVQGRSEKQELASHHQKQVDGIVPNINNLLQGALPGKESDLLKQSLKVNHSSILEECKSKTFRGDFHLRNLFIPQVLGGMGVVPPPGWKYKVTKYDIYVASGYISRRPGLRYTTQRPLPGFDPETLSEVEEVPWGLRTTGKDEELIRVPFKEISYRSIRYMCRSPMFSFYVRNENHFLADPKTKSNRTKYVTDGYDEMYKLFLEATSHDEVD